jgi:hypothetical protein
VGLGATFPGGQGPVSSFLSAYWSCITWRSLNMLAAIDKGRLLAYFVQDSRLYIARNSIEIKAADRSVRTAKLNASKVAIVSIAQ